MPKPNEDVAYHGIIDSLIDAAGISSVLLFLCKEIEYILHLDWGLLAFLSVDVCTRWLRESTS